MFNNDYILRQIELFGKGLRVLVGTEKPGDTEEMISESGELSGEMFLLYRLRRLVYEGSINEAEDLLFEALEKDPTDAYFAVAEEFYAEISKLSDEDLAAADFSREEIGEGLADLARLRDR